MNDDGDPILTWELVLQQDAHKLTPTVHPITSSNHSLQSIHGLFGPSITQTQLHLFFSRFFILHTCP